MADGFEFPSFLKIEHQPNSAAKASFLAEVRGMNEAAQKQFETSFGEIGRIVEKSVASINGKGINLDIGTAGLRQAATEADLTRQKLVAMRDAARALARETGDTSAATNKYLQALSAQVIEAGRAKDAADAQVRTYERLQDAMDRTVRSNQRLADSYRATYLEQARQENFAYRSQQAVNSAFAPGLSRTPKSARDSASVFENQSYAPRADMRSGLDRLLGGDASIDKAALSAASLDQVLGRVAAKGPLVSAALADMAQAEQLATRQAEILTQRMDALAGELDPLVAIQQRFTQQMRLADDALAANVISETRHLEIQGQLRQSLQRTQQVMAGNSAALRQATLQSGQQVQDLAISLYSGQQAAIVFAQQLPQLAFALTYLEGSANKTHDRIGRFATFLSGPYGLLVGVAIGVTAELVTELLGMGNETDKASTKVYDFTKALDYWALGAEKTADAMKQLADATRSAIAEQGDFLASQKINADKGLKDVETRLAANQAALKALNESAGDFTLDPGEIGRRAWQRNKLMEDIAADRDVALPAAQQAALNAEIATSQRRVIDSMDAASAATTRYKETVGELNVRLKETREDPVGAQASGRAISKSEYDRLFGEAKARYDRETEAARAAKRTDRTGSYTTADFAYPVSGPITSGFGPRTRPTAGASANHPAIDFGVPVGTDVRAPQVGTVTAIGFDRGLGKYVVIDHGAGTKSRYAHLSDNSIVTEGQRVEKGDIIAKSGNTGTSTGPHLDYQITRNGKAVDPRKGPFPIDPVKTAEAAEKAAAAIARTQEILQEFGARSAESIQRVNERFNDQPRLIDQAAQATRQLDDIIKELGERKPAGFEQMIADAERAKAVVADALVRPFRELERDSQRNVQIQELMITGREREAAVLQEVWRMQERLGNLLPEQVAEVRRITEAEFDRAEALRIIQEQQAAYLDTTRSIRQEIEGAFSGQKVNFGAVFKQLNARVITEQLFGDMFRDLDKWVQRNTGLGRATDEFTQATDQAGKSLIDLADTIDGVAARFAGGGSIGGLSAGANDNGDDALSMAQLRTYFDTTLGRGAASANGEITVAGGRATSDRPQRVELTGRSVFAMTPEAYFERLTNGLASRMASALDRTFGVQFFSKFESVMARGLQGYATGGAPGAVLGVGEGLAGMFGDKGLAKLFGKAGGGAGTGSMVAGLGNAFGLKMSNTGAQIGGAIGSMIPIPGMDIIGSIAGGLIGKLFGGNKYGSATVTNNAIGTSGNNKDGKAGASSAGDAISEGIKNLAEKLGAEVGDYAVSIGLTNGKWNVNPGIVRGMIGTTKQGDTIDFREDQAAAIEWAMRNAIEDGGIKGLSALENAILRKQPDIDKAVEQVLTVQDMRKRYKQWKDPISAALDDLDKEFTKYRDLLTEFGGSTEDFNQALELYGHEREEIIKAEKQRITQTLQSLYDDLGMGDNGLSLRDRLKNAQDVYNPLAARVKAGDTTAFDDFAAAGRTVLDLQRQLNGSQEGYFSFFNELRDLTKATLDAQQAAIDAASGRSSPFTESAVPSTDNTAVTAAIADQTLALSDALNAQLGAVNDNLGTLIQLYAQSAGGGSNNDLLNAVGVTSGF